MSKRVGIFNPFKAPDPTPEELVESTLSLDGGAYIISITGVNILNTYKHLLENVFLKLTEDANINQIMTDQGVRFTYGSFPIKLEADYHCLKLPNSYLSVFSAESTKDEKPVIRRLAYVMYLVKVPTIYKKYNITVIARR